jgi:hypothetical protein
MRFVPTAVLLIIDRMLSAIDRRSTGIVRSAHVRVAAHAAARDRTLWAWADEVRSLPASGAQGDEILARLAKEATLHESQHA